MTRYEPLPCPSYLPSANSAPSCLQPEQAEVLQVNTTTVTVVSVLFCTSPNVDDFDNLLSIAEDFVDMLYKPILNAV